MPIIAVAWGGRGCCDSSKGPTLTYLASIPWIACAPAACCLSWPWSLLRTLIFSQDGANAISAFCMACVVIDVMGTVLRKCCSYMPMSDHGDHMEATVLAKNNGKMCAVILKCYAGLLQYLLHQDADCSEGLALSWLHSGDSPNNICLCVYIYTETYVWAFAHIQRVYMYAYK